MKFKVMPAVFPGQQMWGAYGKKGTYIILRDGKFTASVKRLGITKYLIENDAAVRTFQVAKAVCEEHDACG